MMVGLLQQPEGVETMLLYQTQRSGEPINYISLSCFIEQRQKACNTVLYTKTHSKAKNIPLISCIIFHNFLTRLCIRPPNHEYQMCVP